MKCKYCNSSKYTDHSDLYNEDLCYNCWGTLDGIQIPNYIPAEQRRKFQLKTYETNKM